MLRRPNRRDIEAWLTHFDRNVVWYAIPDEPEPGPFRGREAVRAMAARWMDSFRDFRMEVEEYLDAGEYVITPARMLGRISDSDANIGIDDVFVNRCRNGKIVEVRECRTRAEALEVAGLSGDAQTSA